MEMKLAVRIAENRLNSFLAATGIKSVSDLKCQPLLDPARRHGNLDLNCNIVNHLLSKKAK